MRDRGHSPVLHDEMAPWLAEKSECVVRSLTSLYEHFRARDGLPGDFIEELTSYLGPALYDATKILSFASNGRWSPEDRDMILEDGNIGLEKVLVAYELLREDQTTEGKRRSRNKAFLARVAELRALLKGARSPSRTLIHKLLLELSSVGIQDPILSGISRLTEQVTARELDWEQYVDRASKLAGELEMKYHVDAV